VALMWVLRAHGFGRYWENSIARKSLIDKISMHLNDHTCSSLHAPLVGYGRGVQQER